MKHPVIALNLDKGRVTFGGEPVQMKLPDGCIGIMLAFESKKKAREWCGKDTKLVRIELESKAEKDNPS